MAGLRPNPLHQAVDSRGIAWAADRWMPLPADRGVGLRRADQPLRSGADVPSRSDRDPLSTFLAHEALDAVPCAIIVTSNDCRVLVANRAAQDVLARRAPFLVEGGHLRCVRPAETASLRHMVAACASDPDRHSALLALRCPHGGRPLAIRIRPLTSSSPGPRSGEQAVGLVFSDRLRSQRIDVDELRALYGLTWAEARAALAVQASHGLQAAAHRLGVSVATARSQLQQVFQKVGVRRQADLVRVVCEDLIHL